MDEEFLAQEQVSAVTGKEGPLGDFVAIAGFHPLWTYGDGEPDAAINWEKRAPHPTISIVRAEGIEGARAATTAVGEANLNCLESLGTERAAILFDRALRVTDIPHEVPFQSKPFMEL